MKRNSWIAAVSAGVLVVAVVGLIIALNAVNRRAEAQVRAQVDEAIADSPMADSVSYGDIAVDAARGTVEIVDMVFEQDGVLLRADTFEVSLPRAEALALARNQENVTITDVTASISGVAVQGTEEDVSLSLDELRVDVQGRVPTVLFGDNPELALENPDNGVRSIAISLSGSSLGLPEGSGVIDLETSSFEVEGDLRFADLAATGADDSGVTLLQYLDTVSFELSELSLVLEDVVREELMMGIATFIGPTPLLEDPSNWHIASMGFSGAVSEQAYEVSDVSVSMPVLEFAGSGSMGVAPDQQPVPPLSVDLNVKRFHDDLRPFFSALAQQIAMTELPPGDSFEFSLYLEDEAGPPEMSLE